MGDLKIDLKFPSKVHFESRSNTGMVKGTAKSLLSGGPIRLMYLCYCLNLQIEGSNMEM